MILEKTIFKIGVHNKNDNSFYTNGTGFFVSHENVLYAVTASHVFDEVKLANDECFVIHSSTIIIENRCVFWELDTNNILTRGNAIKGFEYDIAIAKIIEMDSKSLPRDFENNVLNIEKHWGEFSQGDKLSIHGYPVFYSETFNDKPLNEYIPPYVLHIDIEKSIEAQGAVLIYNPVRTHNNDYRGMSGSPAFVQDKLAGVFTGVNPDTAPPVFLFWRIGLIYCLIKYFDTFKYGSNKGIWKSNNDND